jgi:hypothetical protein
MGAYIYNSRSQEAKAGGSWVKASLGYIASSCLKRTHKNMEQYFARVKYHFAYEGNVLKRILQIPYNSTWQNYLAIICFMKKKKKR